MTNEVKCPASRQDGPLWGSPEWRDECRSCRDRVAFNAQCNNKCNCINLRIFVLFIW